MKVIHAFWGSMDGIIAAGGRSVCGRVPNTMGERPGLPHAKRGVCKVCLRIAKPIWKSYGIKPSRKARGR